MSVSSVARLEPSYRANAGWYIANTRASRAPVAGSAGREVPWTRPIRSPGMNSPERVLAGGDDDGRVEDLELAAQVRRAGGDLVRLRVAVAGRPALHDVGDEDVVAAPADRLDQLRQQIGPRRPRTGRPAWFSSRPGPSPTKTTSVSGLPSPGTALARCS